MRAVVTGGEGFIGAHLVERLVGEGHEVWVYDDGSTGRRRRPGVKEYLQGMVESQIGVAAALEEARPDVVFHLAALSTVGLAEKSPERAIETNIWGTLNVAQKSRLVGARLVNASSAAVYGAAVPLAMGEESTSGPNTIYGMSKEAAESYARMACPDAISLRFSSVYGPGQTVIGENLLVPRLLAYIFGQSQDFGIRGDGEQVRDLVYVSDIVDALIRSADRSAPAGVYNVGFGMGWTVNQICDLAAVAAEYNRDLPRAPAWPHEPRHLVLDISKAKQRLGWTPQTDLLLGLQNTVRAWPKAT